MQKTFEEKLHVFLFVVIFPFLLFFMSYYGFESSYVRLKTVEQVPDFMFSSVYAYRVIPNFLSVHVTELIAGFVENFFSSQKTFILKNGTYFYHATFLINAVFFVLSSQVFYSILKAKKIPDLVSMLIHLAAVFFIVIAQYVPTNCDVIAVFFYLAGVYFTLKYLAERKYADFIFLILIIFISTFVRETACLNIAFFAALTVNFKNLKNVKFQSVKEISVLVGAFILPYIALRLIIEQNASFAEGIYIIKNFTGPFNLAGLLFGITALYFTYILCDKNGKFLLKNYLLFSLPYLIMITLVGLFWETRLFLPLILTGFTIAADRFRKILTV